MRQGITKLNPKCTLGFIVVLKFQFKAQTSHLNLDLIRDTVLFVSPRSLGPLLLHVCMCVCEHTQRVCIVDTWRGSISWKYEKISYSYINILSNVSRNSIIFVSNHVANVIKNSTISLLCFVLADL